MKYDEQTHFLIQLSYKMELEKIARSSQSAESVRRLFADDAPEQMPKDEDR